MLGRRRRRQRCRCARRRTLESSDIWPHPERLGLSPIRATVFRSHHLARASLYSQVKLEDRRLTVAPGPAGQLRQFRDALVVAHARQVLRDRLILRESADTRRAERRSRNALARGPLSARSLLALWEEWNPDASNIVAAYRRRSGAGCRRRRTRPGRRPRP